MRASEFIGRAFTDWQLIIIGATYECSELEVKKALAFFSYQLASKPESCNLSEVNTL